MNRRRGSVRRSNLRGIRNWGRNRAVKTNRLVNVNFVLGVQNIAMSMSVCMSYVRPLVCLKNYTTQHHEIFCTCYLWMRLGPPLMMVQSVVVLWTMSCDSYFPIIWQIQIQAIGELFTATCQVTLLNCLPWGEVCYRQFPCFAGACVVCCFSCCALTLLN